MEALSEVVHKVWVGVVFEEGGKEWCSYWGMTRGLGRVMVHEGWGEVGGMRVVG